MGFCAGSLAMPIFFGGAVADSGALGEAGSKAVTAALLSDAALDQRIELALAAISTPSAPPKRVRARKPKGKQ
jgi:hypothetical protein